MVINQKCIVALFAVMFANPSFAQSFFCEDKGLWLTDFPDAWTESNSQFLLKVDDNYFEFNPIKRLNTTGSTSQSVVEYRSKKSLVAIGEYDGGILTFSMHMSSDGSWRLIRTFGQDDFASVFHSQCYVQ